MGVSAVGKHAQIPELFGVAAPAHRRLDHRQSADFRVGKAFDQLIQILLIGARGFGKFKSFVTKLELAQIGFIRAFDRIESLAYSLQVAGDLFHRLAHAEREAIAERGEVIDLAGEVRVAAFTGTDETFAQMADAQFGQSRLDDVLDAAIRPFVIT